MSNLDVQDASIETLIQLLAVFVRRFGGEAVVTKREMDMVEGLPVFGRHLTPEHLRLRLAEEHELCDCGEVYLDDTPPAPLE